MNEHGTEGLAQKQTLDMRRSIKQCAECGQRFNNDAAFCPFDGNKLEAAMWSPSADSLIGQVVDGRYEIQSVLGEGGMGKVYQVRHTSLDRAFAMKVLRKDLARDEELAARFIQEAKTTASLHHPNIVSISDFGRLSAGPSGDETPYFVMELLGGQTLADVIKAGGPVPAGRAVGIVRQVAGALGAAHSAGVVHRDMKPENVFLLGGMSGGVASDDIRIVDFGAAKIMGTSRLTKTGIVFGTPHYMSPEQASGQAVDHRADIYALGIIMYEMFTGRVPFEADTYMGVLTQHMFVNPVPPSQVSGAARELGALEEITLRALEKKPEDRYATMEELAEDIARVVRFQQDGRVDVQPHLENRPSKPPRSMRYKMADELEPPTLEEMRVAIDSMMPPKNRAPWGWIGAGAVVALVAVGAGVVLTREAAPKTTANAVRAASAPSPTAPPALAVVPAESAVSATPAVDAAVAAPPPPPAGAPAANANANANPRRKPSPPPAQGGPENSLPDPFKHP